MQKYLGVKEISAKPMNLGDYNKHKGWDIPADEDPAKEGFLVEYEGGYQSWTPKEPFDNSHRPIDEMTFGFAIEALKLGKKVARAGWNGKAMFVALQEGSSFPAEAARGGVAKKIADSGEDHVILLPHIDMKTATGEVCVGWLASQTDMLAEDWTIVE